MSALLAVVLLSSCSRPPLEFADWIIEVPEGTPVHEYAPVPMDERDPDAIRLTEELVIGADPDNPDEGVFRPTFVVAGEDGTIFVFDGAVNHVQAYDREGRYLRTLGHEGQGPGEFSNVWGMTIAGERLVVDDRGNDRFSAWNLDGEHAGDYRKEDWVFTRDLQGLDDGTVVFRTSVGSGDGLRDVIVRTSLDGTDMAYLDELVPAPPVIPDSSWTAVDIAQGITTLFDDPIRSFAVGAGDVVIISPVQQYQLMAVAPDGTPRWATRVAWPRPAISSRVKKAVLTQAGRDGGVVSESDVDWPDYRVVARLLTDGHGRVYVIPEIGFDGEPPARLPADVYSPDGELIASGLLPAQWPESGASSRAPWSFALGDRVFGLREDVDGETVVVRYRLRVRSE